MESHVKTGIAPLTVGALRQAILAELIGNRLFTQAEQLLANHQIHECEDVERLAVWLRNVAREAERRQQAAQAQLREARKLAQPSPDAALHELCNLLECPAFTKREKRSEVHILAHFATRTACKTEIMNHVGRLYIKLLHRNGKLDERYGYAE